MLDLPSKLNISSVFNVDDLISYHDTFEPPLSTNARTGNNSPKALTLLQYKDIVEVILDDHLIMSATSITRHFLVK